jgi:hypothetical protein
MMAGFFSQEPGETRVMVFFGKYRGTFSETGFFWVNPFMDKKKLSLRARNLDGEPIKVNDKVGNPIMIGLVLVWKLKDTYKAMFEIDSQTLAQKTADGTTNVVGRMKAFEDFVRVQSDAALRQVAGHYAYDETGSETEELTLRSGGEEINERLEQQLNERLDMAGIDGANSLQVMFRILLPVSMPCVASVSLFTAVTFWNNYTSALLYLGTSEKWYPLSLYILNYIQTPPDVLDTSMAAIQKGNIEAAMIVVSIIPILLVYPFVLKYFTKGVTVGAVKG